MPSAVVFGPRRRFRRWLRAGGRLPERRPVAAATANAAGVSDVGDSGCFESFVFALRSAASPIARAPIGGDRGSTPASRRCAAGPGLSAFASWRRWSSLDGAAWRAAVATRAPSRASASRPTARPSVGHRRARRQRTSAHRSVGPWPRAARPSAAVRAPAATPSTARWSTDRAAARRSSTPPDRARPSSPRGAVSYAATAIGCGAVGSGATGGGGTGKCAGVGARRPDESFARPGGGPAGGGDRATGSARRWARAAGGAIRQLDPGRRRVARRAAARRQRRQAAAARLTHREVVGVLRAAERAEPHRRMPRRTPPRRRRPSCRSAASTSERSGASTPS